MPYNLMIIIISENNDVRSFLKDDLSKFHYQILEATDGKSAINLIRKNKPHLALIDFNPSDKANIDFVQLVVDESPKTEPVIITEQPIIKSLGLIFRIFFFAFSKSRVRFFLSKSK